MSWRDELLATLLKMQSSAFERLIQRLLKESGFIQVEVTGKSGDGGIDGKGIMRLSGLLSFHVLFQCKRYQGSVSASQVRDFRGAMMGRADKGLLITTGNFTKDAQLTLELPDTLYAQLEGLAQREGVQLTQYIVYVLTLQAGYR